VAEGDDKVIVGKIKGERSLCCVVKSEWLYCQGVRVID